MHHAPRALVAALSLCALFCVALPAAPRAAERIELLPRYRPGDAYSLALSATTNTDAFARGALRRMFREDVEVHYEALVRVLEVDRAGRPLREMHSEVRARFERPRSSGSLFREGASYEVLRSRDGSVRVSAGGQRLPRAAERVVEGLLSQQFEYGLGARLLDPGRPVEVGESWVLDPKLTRRFLRERGAPEGHLAGVAVASLRRGPSSRGRRTHEIVYSIPVVDLQLDPLPADAQLRGSGALLEGRVELPADRMDPTVYASTLDARWRGVLIKTGRSLVLPWRLQRWTLADQTTRRLAPGRPDALALLRLQRERGARQSQNEERGAEPGLDAAFQ